MAIKKIDAATIGDWFLAHVNRQSGDAVTHLKLQKLIYYAQAWFMANYNKQLFREELEAWAHGPVAPSVWQKFKEHRWDALPKPPRCPVVPADVEAVLKAVADNYGRFDAKYLEDLTHRENPWKDTRGDLPAYARCTSPISKELIRDFYGEKIGKKWQGRVAVN